MEENIKMKDILEIIYQAEESVLDKKIKQINRNIKDKIKDIKVEGLLENCVKTDELEKLFNQIEENYSIKIAEYNKGFYKQGFIDGVNLMINCLKT